MEEGEEKQEDWKRRNVRLARRTEEEIEETVGKGEAKREGK